MEFPILVEGFDKGDAFVVRVIERAIEYLARAMRNLMYLSNPEIIVIGGGVFNLGENCWLHCARTCATGYSIPTSIATSSILHSAAMRGYLGLWCFLGAHRRKLQPTLTVNLQFRRMDEGWNAKVQSNWVIL